MTEEVNIVMPPGITTYAESTETAMPVAIKKDWGARLRSGDYTQGRSKLHTATRLLDGTEQHEFCCLGVLCEMAVEAGIVDRVDVSGTEEFVTSPEGRVFAYVPKEGQPNAGSAYVHYAPPAVAKWAGLPFKDTNPYVLHGGARSSLADINDNSGRTFSQIADMIEKQF